MRVKPFLTTVCLLLSALYGVCQDQSPNGGFAGILRDSTSQKGVEYATIRLALSTGNALKTILADKDGVFKVGKAASGSYTITISATSYVSKTLAGIVVDSSGGLTDLGIIWLSRSAAQLKDVIITANKPVIKQEVDRIIYDVQADPDSKAGSIWLLLPKLPLVSINGEDKLLLKGSGNFKVLLDGRNSALVARRPEDIFKVLPANSIERIEIITIPPAKYDAEGLSGILNVVMKKNIGQRYIGSINASYGPLYSTLGGLFTTKGRKFGISLNGGEYWETAPSTGFNGTFENYSSSPYSLSQNGNKQYKGATTAVNVQADYELDSLHLLTASAGINALNSHDYTNQNTFMEGNSGNLITSYATHAVTGLKESSLIFGLNYEAGCRRSKEQLLTVSYNFNYAPSNQDSRNQMLQIFNYPESNLRQLNKTVAREQTFQVDYLYPMSHVNIEGGAKLISRDNNADYSTGYLDSSSNTYKQDSLNSNTFKYLQNIYGLYNSYLVKAGKWGVSAGIRFEMTETEANFISNSKTVKQSYGNFIPNFSVQRRISMFSNVNIGYTQRIQRPAIWQLNPFVNKLDPAFYVTGNPDLKTVTSHEISASFSWFKKGYLQTGVNYAFSSNTIQRVTSLGNDSISYVSYQNVGKNKALQFNANLNYPLSRMVSFSLNGLISYIWVSGTVMDQLYSNKGVQGNAYCYLSMRFKKNWRAALNAGFFSPTVILQGQSSGFFYSSLRIMKSLLNNQMTISASVTNPYQQYRTLRNKLETPAFLQDYSYLKASRTFTIGLNYNFGKLRDALKKSRHSIQNDDISTKKSGSEKGAQ